MPEQVSYKRLAWLAILFALVWWQWNAPWLYPLRILVTLFHEFGHGLAGILTGGHVERITIDPAGGGVCYTRGGLRWVILPAGYLGSMATGCLILLLASRTHQDRFVSLVLGLGLLLGTAIYVRTPVGLTYGALMGAALASAGWWLPEDLNDLILSFIGTTNCLYAFFDLKYLITLGRGYNDATLFSDEILPLPPVVWAVLWTVISLGCLLLTLRVALHGEGTPHPERERLSQ